MKFVSVSACPVIGGKLKAVDDSYAKAVKGVRQIVLLDNAVAVVADHTGAARKGLAALKITWDEGANAACSNDTLVKAMDAASKAPGLSAIKTGDAETGIKHAAGTVEAIYQMPFLAHATMEPMNCTVDLRPNSCEVWLGTQVPTRAQAIAAQISGLALEKVTIHNHLLGGGFGRRLDVDYVEQAILIAKQVKGPIKVIWSREEDTQHSILRPYYYDRLAAGVDKEGIPVAFTHRVTGSSILARWAPKAFVNGMDADAVEGAAGSYEFGNVTVDYVRHEPPAGITTGWWRGVGMTHNAFVVEGFIDELAVRAKQDPVEYRRRLLKNAPRALAALNLAASKADWGKVMPAGHGRGIAVAAGFGSFVAQVVEVSVAKDGSIKVHRIVCAIDSGTQIDPDTIRAQMEGGAIFGLSAALYGEITFKNGRVEQGNFDSYQVMRIEETPKIDVYLMDSGESPGGVGEVGTTLVGPALFNAIYAATGKRLRKLPVNNDELKSA